MLKGKCIILGVTGSIAAYKIPNLASSLVKLGADVNVIMTQNATNFITPITFETLTCNKCIVDIFDRNYQNNVEHIALSKRCDIFLVAPATANIIGKIANGIADDMLTTTIMACKAPIIISPAMNVNMYENSILQNNLKKLKKNGYEIIDPTYGHLACGDMGEGKMPEPKVLLAYILHRIAYKKHVLAGKKVLVTAGPTQERIDPIRFITNHSTGKMGYSIAENCVRRGADVTLITGPCYIPQPLFVNIIHVISAADMAIAVKSCYKEHDIIIKTAAVADFTPTQTFNEKIKKNKKILSFEFKQTEDILEFLGKNRRDNQFICGFAMETENTLENAKAKLSKKNVDMIVANDLSMPGSGFGIHTNIATIITKKEYKKLGILSKEELSSIIVDEIIKMI